MYPPDLTVKQGQSQDKTSAVRHRIPHLITIILHQGFSLGAPWPWRCLGCHSWEAHWCLLCKAQDAVKHPTAHRTDPHDVELATLHINSAKVQKPCSGPLL